MGIAERQKLKKQGRDDHKTVKYTNLLHIFFCYTRIYYGKRSLQGVVYLTVL